MALTVFYTPRWRAIDANGNPMNGAKLKFYEAGTATPLPVYADVNGNTSLGVTITADAGGLFAELFMLAQAYKVELYTSADVLVWSADDFFPPQPASASSISLVATAGVTFAAGETAYISDGSGGLNAGQMYKGDADLEYAANSPMVYFAVSAITAGNTGLFISEGLVTGLAGLTPGARYYLSGTAGAITTTPGTFARYVGQAVSTTTLALASNPPLLPDVDSRIKHICDGRLTLTTGVPVTTADVTAATTIYFALYKGNQIALYTGSRWVVMTFAQLSIAVPAAANQMYDVFVDYNDGTPILALTAWTNDTTRATALTTQNGVYVKTGDTQQRYVGSFRTTSVAGQTEDSLTYRGVYNYYNRVPRPLEKFETTTTWTYNTFTWRQARATATNQVAVVNGVAESPVLASVSVLVQSDTPPAIAGIAIGLDSTTTPAANQRIAAQLFITANQIEQITSLFEAVIAVGYHTLVWLEKASAGGATTTFYSNDPAAFSGLGVQSGIKGSVMQ